MPFSFARNVFPLRGRKPAVRRARRCPYAAERRALFAVGFAIVALAGLYMYFITASVMNVVLRKELEMERAEVHTRLSALEEEYLTKVAAIDRAHAEALGLVPLAQKRFVTVSDIAEKPLVVRSEE